MNDRRRPASSPPKEAFAGLAYRGRITGVGTVVKEGWSPPNTGWFRNRHPWFHGPVWPDPGERCSTAGGSNSILQ
jgi:hypothetical protein